jgi:hypothetical protein
VIQAREIAGICRVQRRFSGDHEIRCPAAGFPARGDHGCGHPAVGQGDVRVEGDRVELVLSTLQDI